MKELEKCREVRPDLLTEDDWDIAEIAKNDKETLSPITDPALLYAGGVIRATEHICISPQEERISNGYLQKVHGWAGKYVDFYSGKKEVQKVSDLERFRNK